MGLQSCRPLSGAVIGGMRTSATPATIALQSCRPLSGAVIRQDAGDQAVHPQASIVPPPFGSGYPSIIIRVSRSLTGFNRAAPFRERLYRHMVDQDRTLRAASIVPPPFGSGYCYYAGSGRRQCGAASIVPPPFGSGYLQAAYRLSGDAYTLQSCRPLSGAVIITGMCCKAVSCIASIVPPPFGSGYAEIAIQTRRGIDASIVPPPFGSGYISGETNARKVLVELQSCRPLSGAVIMVGLLQQMLTW